MGGLWSCFLQRSAKCALLLVIVSGAEWLRADEPPGSSACLWAGRMKSRGLVLGGLLGKVGCRSVRNGKACSLLRFELVGVRRRRKWWVVRWRAAAGDAHTLCTQVRYARHLGANNQEGPVARCPVFVMCSSSGICIFALGEVGGQGVAGFVTSG
ncbi:hypothetical protein B0T19DRAFT_22063 [Cercophora scortea]|uniref:Secreted protein n=1 Tax=Cercophora scortea TaxID=314031 RepID=A0AAE0J2U4_9PEZI|nr:hypothetical protein B0T19DRAFT_22063 [Cercophora scortea]